MMNSYNQTERILSSERNLERMCLDMANVGLTHLNSKGIVQLANRKACEILECTECEAIGKEWFETFLPEPIRDSVKTIFNQIMKGETAPIEYYVNAILTKTGKKKFLSFHNVITKNSEGHIDGVITSFEDITDRKNTVSTLKKSEEQFRKIFEEGPLGMVYFDNNYQIINVNKCLCFMLGYSKQELLESNLSRIIIQKSDPKEEKIFPDLFDNKISSNKSSKLLLKKNGERIWSIITATTIYDIDGLPMNGLFMIEDITSVMEAEIKLNNYIDQLTLSDQIGTMLTGEKDLSLILQECCEAITGHFGAAFTRIWTIDKSNKILELQASAGMYTQIDGKHRYITSTTNSKIWSILKEKKNILTNKIIGDSRILDQDWARNEGMASFAGYPLMVSTRVLGVLAIFSKKKINLDKYETMRSITQKIALGISRKWFELEQFRLQRKLRSLTGHLQLVQEKEKKNLARELHDELGQFLTAINLELFNLKEICSDTMEKKKFTETNSSIKQISQLMETSINITEKMVMNLRPVILDDLGLMAALKWLVSQMDKHSKIECKFETDIKYLELNQEKSIALYRILQENINNISRHSQATNLGIILKEENRQIHIIISDNGIGFDVEESVNPKSFGIMGMQERAYIFGWDLKFESKIGVGTVVSLKIPKGDR